MKPASVGEGIEDGRPAVAETGEEHWAEVRRQWTKGFTARTEEEKQRVCVGSLKLVRLQKLTWQDLAIQLEKTTMERLVGYYKKITNSRGTFTKPMPLSHLIAILVAGWKDAGPLPPFFTPSSRPGLWPPESSLHEAILEKGLDPKDYNLSVHLSNVLDSDGPLEKEPHLPVSKILSRRNVTNRT